MHSPAVAFNPDLPVIDSSATLSADGRTLYLAVINREESKAVSTRIDLDNWTITSGSEIHAFELSGTNRDAANPYGNAAEVNIHEKRIAADSAAFTYSFPPHSVTILELGASSR